jgi:hypothetical protein
MSSVSDYLKKVSFAGLATITFVLLSSQMSYAQSSDDAYSVSEFDISGAVDLEVQTSGGSISVIGSNEGEVVVEMYVRRKGNYVEAGEADLDDFDIDITKEGNMIKAIADRKSKRGLELEQQLLHLFCGIYSQRNPDSPKNKWREFNG